MVPHSGPLSKGLAGLIYPPPFKVAVLGASPDPRRASHECALALLRWGYDVYPIRPGAAELFGRRVYAALKDLPTRVDIVDVFRRSEHVHSHLDDILAASPRVLWLQDGVRDDAVADAARSAGIEVVQDDCLARRVAQLRATHAA